MRSIPTNSTPIINEIIEALAFTRLSTNEFNVVMAIIRKTYGWDKKEDYISGSQLAIMTKMLPQHCYRALKKLEQKNIILKHKNMIGLNKHCTTWLVPTQVLKIPKQVVPVQVVEHTQAGTKNDTQAGTNKRNHKDTYTKLVPKGTVTRRVKLAPEERKKRAKIHRAENDIMLEFLKKKIRVDDFTELNEEKRRWVYLIVALFKKLGKETCRDRLDSILRDSFLAKNCNSLKFVYKQLKGFREAESLLKTNIIS